MPSYIPTPISTSYEFLFDIRTLKNISRKAIHVQNKSNTIVWLRFNNNPDHEFAFCSNALVTMDLVNIFDTVYIKAEAPITAREVIITVW